MSGIKDILRPIFRILSKPHIYKICKSTKIEFDKYKNKYDGMRCFIVANGPSLRMSDLDLIYDSNEITFGMNRIYVLFDRTKWRPNFYMVQDPTVIRSCYNEIIEQVDNSIIFAKVPGERKYDLPNAIYYKLDYKNVTKNIPPDFFDGTDCKFADGKSVMHTALQLAIYMGFKQIYLIGADCNYSIDNKSINKDSYPDRRMYEQNKSGMPPDIEYTFEAYKVAKEYAEKHGVKIYNATRGGMLEIFERVNLDDIIEREDFIDENSCIYSNQIK